MSKSTELQDRLSSRLKAARREKNLSLDAIAKLSGVSRSMVSQIERRESSPTVATLWNLTRALQMDLAELLDPGEAPPVIEVMQAEQTPTIEQRGDGLCIRILSPPEDAGRFEVYDLQFEPDGILDSQPHATGAHEQLTVVSGTLQLTSAGEIQLLRAGDTARYAADCPHCIAAPGEAARAFLIVRG